MTRSAISHQLRVLKLAKLVRYRKGANGLLRRTMTMSKKSSIKD